MKNISDKFQQMLSCVPQHCDKMYDIPMYLEISNEDNNIPTTLGPFSSEEDIKRLAPYTSEEDLEKLVETCPQLQDLIDTLDLRPVNAFAEEDSHDDICPF